MDLNKIPGKMMTLLSALFIIYMIMCPIIAIYGAVFAEDLEQRAKNRTLFWWGLFFTHPIWLGFFRALSGH